MADYHHKELPASVVRRFKSSIPLESIRQRVAYFGHACWMCKGPYHCLDHIVNKSDVLCNLRPACISCNSRKTNRWTHTVPSKYAERIARMMEPSKPKSNELPKVCPKCKSPYWDKARRNTKEEK